MNALSLEGKIAPNAQPGAETLATSSWKRDLLNIVMLSGLTFWSVYYAPPIFSRLLFLALLPLIFRSKADYLWLAWFMVIIDAPGRLFSATGLHDLRLPIYSLASGVSLEFQELFLATYLMKALLVAGREQPFVFKKAFHIFFVGMGIYLANSVVLGMDGHTIILAFRNLLPWTWVFIVPCFINGPEKVVKLGRLLFPFIFLALALQIHSFIVGNHLDNIMRGLPPELSLAVKEDSSVSRSYSSVYLSLVGMTLASFVILSKKKLLRPASYPAAVVFCALAIVVLSATRGYIIAFGSMALGLVFLMFRNGKIGKIFSLALASMAIIFILQFSFPLIGKQFSGAMERFSTLELLASGDITAGGTLQRFDVRGIRVLNKFKESPVIGWGFSNTYFRYSDAHVGQHNLLLNVGVVGFIFLNLLFFHLLWKILKYASSAEVKERWGNAAYVFFFGLLAIYIIHSTSSQCWGYIMHFDQMAKVFTYGLIIGSFNALVLPPENDRRDLARESA